jgi:hypothetical protein
MKFQHTPAPPNSGVQLYRRSYGQQRLGRFGLTLIVMGISFILYYLGLFGGVDGPLNPSRLGAHLTLWGVSKAHLLMFATGMTLLTLTWNWIYNLAGFLLGTRRTCRPVDAHFHPLKKGTIGHMLWVISVMFTFIVFYASYC